MIKAAGAIFLSLESGCILMNLRSATVNSPLTWGFWGGKLERNERVLAGLSRELREEMGFIPKYVKVIPMDVFRSFDLGFEYYSFVVVVNKDFMPRINHESAGWGWFKLDNLPKPLHGGARAVLQNQQIIKNIKEILKEHSK